MQNEKSTWKWKPFCVILAVVVVLWMLVPRVMYCLSIPEKPDVFSSVFGAVSALFSGGAFAGIIYALYLQQKQIEMQRKHNEKQFRMTDKQLKIMQQALESEEARQAQDAKPYLSLKQDMIRGNNTMEIKIENSGGTIRDVNVTSNNSGVSISNPDSQTIKSNETKKIVAQWGPDEINKISFTIEYTDTTGTTGKLHFKGFRQQNNWRFEQE